MMPALISSFFLVEELPGIVCMSVSCFIYRKLRTSFRGSVFFNQMVYRGLITKYPAKSSYILAGKTCIHLTIFSKLAAHQVKFGFDTSNLETIWHQLHVYVAGYISLAAFKIGFDIPHHRVKDLAFMEPVAIKLCKLVLPLQLPFT